MSDEKEWYLPDENNKEPSGPFTTEAITQMLEKGNLHWDNYIWERHTGGAKWKRIFEYKDFHYLMKKYPTVRPPQKFSRGRKSVTAEIDFTKREGEYGIQNIYRRFPRVPLDVEVIVHNKKQVLSGHSTDISEKGSFVQLETDNTFDTGEEVIATFRNLPQGIGTFSVNCAVLRTTNNPGQPGLGLFFLKINPRVRRQLAKYIITELRKEHEAESA